MDISIATITCSKFVFYIHCTRDGHLNEEYLQFDHADVDETCELSCPANNVSISIKGKLNYIENDFKISQKVIQSLQKFHDVKIPNFGSVSFLWNNIFESFNVIRIVGIVLVAIVVNYAKGSATDVLIQRL